MYSTLIKNIDKKAPIKIGDRIMPTNKMLTQIEEILAFMQDGEEYRSSEIGELLDLKENRTRTILRYMVSRNLIEAIGNNRNRRYVKIDRG